MARPFQSEMALLADTFDWAADCDTGALSAAVQKAAGLPLRVVGSGGSLTAAHLLADVHQRFTGRLASVATPLEALHRPLVNPVSTWLLTAGGRNVDILNVARAEAEREPTQLAVLCGAPGSPLADLCQLYPFVDLVATALPAGKDGFLATNSLLAFVVLISRSYSVEYAGSAAWELAASSVSRLLRNRHEMEREWKPLTENLWNRPNLVVLHGPTTTAGAIDLESKFTEAALANVQLADFRNFAHGRHHWLAKNGDSTSIVAFVTESDKQLAERTLALIPKDIPSASMFIDGDVVGAGIAAIVAAMWLTGWAGESLGIDPGRPGVPDFGRKLYHLRLPTVRQPASIAALTPRTRVAIERKSGCSLRHLVDNGQLDEWVDAHSTYREQLGQARLGAAVVDYDGTLVSTTERFDPPAPAIVRELTRLLVAGISVGIATGRGGSVRRDLQSVLPRELWPRVVIGYYNGAEIASLDDDGGPDIAAPCSGELAELAAALSSDNTIARLASQEVRPHQITLTSARIADEERLWNLVHQTVLKVSTSLAVTRSSHSIDVVAAGVSKLNVTRHLNSVLAANEFLTIGDRGRWPGNDHELLRGPFSLSVDEVSADQNSCWNLGLPGMRGTTTTVEYLEAFEARDGLMTLLDRSLT